MKDINEIVYNDCTRNLILCGPVGVGKTYQAKKILDKFDKKDKYIISDAEFKQMVKSNILKLRNPVDWETPKKYYPLEIMISCKILLYDDIGVSDVSDPYLRDLTFILDKRIEKKLTTIFTTNLDKKELDEKLNERISSRILFNADVIIMQGNDKRLKTTEYFNLLNE